MTYLKLGPSHFFSESRWMETFFVAASCSLLFFFVVVVVVVGFLPNSLFLITALMSRWADCSTKSPVPSSSLWRSWSFRKTPQRQKVPEYIYLLLFMSRSWVPPSTFFPSEVVKVMLTVRVNGWPLGGCPHLHYSLHGFWGTADRNRTSYYRCACFFTSSCSRRYHAGESLFFLFSPEDDSNEVKIGTSCKNGGCTKVSDNMFAYRHPKIQILLLKCGCFFLAFFFLIVWKQQHVFFCCWCHLCLRHNFKAKFN